ncbi:MAG: hypothetical protein ACODAA_02180, partial [Gemmatimonadota bacterium]
MASSGESLADRLREIRDEGLAAFETASDADELEAARVRWLGRSGALSDAMSGIGDVDPADRPATGRLANEVKSALEAAHEARESALAASEKAAERAGRDLT